MTSLFSVVFLGFILVYVNLLTFEMLEDLYPSRAGREVEVIPIGDQRNRQLNPDLFKISSDCRRQREVSAFHDLRPEPLREPAGQLLGDLITASPDAGSDVGSDTHLARLLDSFTGDPRQGTTPAGVHHTHALISDERHRGAVGNSDHQRETLFIRYQRVGLSSEPGLAHLSNPVPGNL